MQALFTIYWDIHISQVPFVFTNPSSFINHLRNRFNEASFFELLVLIFLDIPLRLPRFLAPSLTVTVYPGKELVLGIWYLGPLVAYPAAREDDADSQSNNSIVDSSPLDWRRHLPRQTCYQSLVIPVVPHTIVNGSVFEKILPMRVEHCIDRADTRLVHTHC